MNETGHTKFVPSCCSFVDMYFGEKAECGAEQMKAGTQTEKSCLVNKDAT